MNKFFNIFIIFYSLHLYSQEKQFIIALPILVLEYMFIIIINVILTL